MTVINVAPSVYYEAATICHRAATEFFTAYAAQLRAMNATAQMAGSVGAGKQWAGSYDQQVRDTNNLVSALVMALDNYTGILIQAGHNYALADHEPATGTPAPEKPPTPPLAFSSCPIPPPSAGGPGSGLVDDGLELAQKIGLDLPVPDGDTDKLTTAANTWNTAATAPATTNLPRELERAAALFQTVTAPEASFIDEDLRELKSAAEDLITTFTDLATACRDQKTALDDLRTQLEDILQQLATEIAKEIAITLALTIAASVVSFGIGGTAVAAIRAGKAADKVADFVTKIRAIVAAAKLKTAVTLQKSTTNTRHKLQRIIDLVKKHGDDVKKGPKKSLREKLDEAQVTTDRRITIDKGPPNGYIVKRDANGNITNYVQFDENGRGIKRVDLTGRPHGGVPTPHVVEMDHNVAPDGRVFVREQRGARPATPEEVP